MELNQLIMLCKGTRTEEKEKKSFTGDSYTYYRHFRTEDELIVPDNIYIEITGTATAGTIGKLVDIDFAYDAGLARPIGGWDTTFIIQCDDREATNRIHYGHARILDNHTGPAKYVRSVNKRTKEEVPAHVNKWGQTLEKGNWCVGLGTSKKVHFGQIVRWSKTSIWVTPVPEEKNPKTFCISHPSQTLRLPDGVDYTQEVTMMVLTGWRF
jgi:hypothetical protein